MAGKSSPAARPGSVRDQLDRLFEDSSGVDGFVHELMAFLVDLSKRHPNHPMLTALSDEFSRASGAPLAASAMHDLRSILQGVSAGLDYAPILLERSGVLSQEGVDRRRIELLLEALDDARTGSRMAAELASQALEIQRDCMTPRSPAGARVRLNETVTIAARLAGRMAPLEIKLETPHELEVQASRSALVRVLVNLLRNAAHAIDELEDPIGAGVVISSWASDEFVFVQVADEGPGIPATAVSDIFDLFYSTHAEGTGIGLYVCKTLVSAWGGRIHVDSDEGEGARFTFSVPRTDVESS